MARAKTIVVQEPNTWKQVRSDCGVDAATPVKYPQVGHTLIVREEDARKGERGSHCKCAVSQALVASFPNSVGVSASMGSVYVATKIDNKTTIYCFKPSSPLRRSMVEYDTSGYFAPGEYRLGAVPLKDQYEYQTIKSRNRAKTRDRTADKREGAHERVRPIKTHATFRPRSGNGHNSVRVA